MQQSIGKVGDQINALAMAIGFNLRKILRKLFLWLLASWLNILKTPDARALPT
ncbi:MAG: hypothetical protein PHW76_03295 [Alphaproteobacteria bacterium]|nr:hypothetical protein [Alphaproteobacteria bacterium]